MYKTHIARDREPMWKRTILKFMKKNRGISFEMVHRACFPKLNNSILQLMGVFDIRTFDNNNKNNNSKNGFLFQGKCFQCFLYLSFFVLHCTRIGMALTGLTDKYRWRGGEQLKQ